ncbi:MAG: ThiF family adenylyltransferase [Neptuniibacter sp.]
MNWWDLWTGRKQAELDRFYELGWNPVDVSTPEDLESGVMIVEIEYSGEGGEFPLTVRFPSEYPYFCGFAFLDPEHSLLARHHNPVSGELCLMAEGGAAWIPDMKMGDVIHKFFPRVIRIAEDPMGEYATEHEIEQGEPVSGYYSRDDKTLIMVEEIDVPVGVDKGSFTAVKLRHEGHSRYAMLELFDHQKNSIAKASDALYENVKECEKINGYWHRWEKTAAAEHFEHPFAISDFRQLPPYISLAKWRPYIQRTQKKPALFATLYQEEVQHRKQSQAWCVVETTPLIKKNKVVNVQCKRISVAPYSKEVRTARTPELTNLDNKAVTIVGAGMLGSQIALQLARSGVGHITVIDYDFIELATCIRYGLGAEYAHWSKSEALAHYLKKNYPCTKITDYRYRFGCAFPMPAKERAQMFERIGASDLVIDAAAESQVSHYLCHLMRAEGKPLMSVTTRPGSWGGEAWISMPGEACWECFGHYWQEGFLPAANGDDENDRVQIGGCSAPTSVGNGFDSDIVSLHAVRNAIGLLLQDEAQGYPSPECNTFRINLRGEKGEMITPECVSESFQPHPKCSCQAGGG